MPKRALEYTIATHRNDCLSYVSTDQENNLRDLFEEEGDIATNLDLYLPN